MSMESRTVCSSAIKKGDSCASRRIYRGSMGIVECSVEVAKHLMDTYVPNPLYPEADMELARILIAAEKEKLVVLAQGY